MMTITQISALKAELQTDPSSLGYSSAARNDQAMADVINFVRDGVTACPVNAVVGTAISVFRDSISKEEIIEAITDTDFSALTQSQVNRLQLLFAGAPVLNATRSAVRSKFGGIFSAGATLTALTALASRKGSRAEQLFGINTQVSISDVGRALNP